MTDAIARAWADLPDAVRAHPGIKALYRAALAAAAQEREACAHLCDGIGAGYTGEARRLAGPHATHAAGQRDGANECAAAIRTRAKRAADAGRSTEGGEHA